MEEGEEEVEEEEQEEQKEEEEEKREVEEEVEKRKEEEKKEQKEEKKRNEEYKEKGKKKRKEKEEKKEEVNTGSYRSEEVLPEPCTRRGGGWRDLPASKTDRRLAWLSSRDKLSVNTKTVRFWKILLAQAERAY